MDNTPRARDGKYRKHPACDGCGKPALDYCTDASVCGDTDGPGFVVCERRACERSLEGLGVEERRAHYTAQRAENVRAEREGRNPVVIAKARKK